MEWPIGQGHSKKNLRFERRSKIHKSVRQSWRDDSFFGCIAKVALSSVPLLGNSRKTPLIWHLGRIFIAVFALFFLFLHKIISTAGSDLVFFLLLRNHHRHHYYHCSWIRVKKEEGVSRALDCIALASRTHPAAHPLASEPR